MIHTRGESFDAREGSAAIAAAPDSAVVTIPDAHFLFTADFKRKGSDLVLTGEDGRKILVPDYFRQEKLPDLVSPEGAILSANVVELLAGPATPGQYAQAGAPAAPQPIGRVETAAGSATAVRNGVAVELNVGDLVFQGDVVQTLTSSALAIAFSDGSAFTLNENARMALNEFVYDPNGTANSALINLVQGTVSFIAAQVAKTGTMRVETPTAVLGIRGTFITLSVSSVDGHTVASLGLESHPVTGDQFAGAFTLTNRITGNQVLVSQVNSIFSVSPGGTTSESPKPAEIHALEQATFQALVPVLQSAANLGVQTGLNQGTNQNLNQNPNQNPAQDGQQGQKSDSSPGPSPGGSSGANPADNQPPADTKPTTVPLTPAGPETQPPPATPAQTPVPTNTLPVTTPQTPTQTPTQTHITPTGSVADVAKTEAPGAQFESFNIFERVSIANAGSATGFVDGSAVLVSATYTSGLPSTFTNAAFLSSLLTVDAAGTVHYDLGKFNFLSAGHWLSYTIAFDVASGTDTLHLTLTFTVNGANEAPRITVAAGDAASATITDDTHATTLPVAGGTLSFKDADSADGHSVSVAVKSGPAIGSFAAGVIADTTGSDPANVTGDILWAFAANKAQAQSLAAGESETEVFTVTLHDGQGGSTSQDVAVTVAGVNDAPVAVANTVAVNEDATVSATTRPTGVLGNDTDPDTGETSTLVVSAVRPGTSGTMTALTGGTAVVNGTYGTLTIHADGTYSYTPNDAAPQSPPPAADVFTYTAKDIHNATATTTLTFNVAGQNDAPVAMADTAAATEDALPNTVNGNVLTNDTDVDTGDTHTVSAVTIGEINGTDNGTTITKVGTYGTLVVTKAIGGYTYTLANGQANVQALAQGQQVTDVFSYTNSDNHGGSSSSTLTVTITGVNDTPTPVANTVAVNEDAPVSATTRAAGVLGNDTDPDTGETATLTVSAILAGTSGTATPLAEGTASVNGTYGTLTIHSDGTYSYTPNNAAAEALPQDTPATDVFTYTAKDVHGATATATLTFNITGLNDAPTLAAGTTATGHMVADTQGAGAPLTELAASYLTASHNLINGLGGSSGFGETDLAQGDDNSSSAIDITPVFGAAGLNFFGQHYTSLYINNNGNITFNAATTQFTPSVITAGANNPIIAPFWADVDTRGGAASATPGGNSTGANRVHYDLDTVNGVMTVTWDDVGYYNQQTNRLNAFQVQLINVGNGDFDIVFRYEDINWTTGTASGGSNGLGGTPARAGYSAGDDNSAHYFELPQSGNQTQILALESTAGNTGIAGVDAFEVRGGNVIPSLTASGTVQFADVDLADSHSVAVSLASAVRSGEGAVPAATQSDLLHALTTSMTAPNGHDSTGTGSGALGWTFALPNADATFLAADETLTVIYNVTISDGHGGSVTQPVTLIITGAEHRTDWNSAANGNWETAANWSDGVPSSTMAALIAAAGATDYTVTVTSSSAQAHSLNVADSHATVAVEAGNSLTIADALTVDAGKITLNGGTVQAGLIDLESGGTLQGWGTVSGPISNYGLIQAFSAHTLNISGNITGTGSLQIVNNTTVEIDGSVAATQTLSFVGGATGTLVLDHSSTFHGVLSGLVDSHQKVDLKDFTFTSGHMTAVPTYTNGYTTLVVSNDVTHQSVSLTLAGDYTNPLQHTWHFDPDSGTGTILYDPPATDAGARNPTVADSVSTDVAQTVAALTNVDQFTFQDDAESGTLPGASTLVASNEDASATDAATLEATADTSSDDQSTTAATANGSAGTDPTSNLATNLLPATGDSTGNGPQVGATVQPASASTATAGLAGGDTFVFAANFGNVTIGNFHPETDVIEIDHTVFADFQELLAAAHDDGNGNAVIAADPQDTITLKNVTVAQLVQHQGDFHFA